MCHRVGTEFVRRSKCIPMVFTTESILARGESTQGGSTNGLGLFRYTHGMSLSSTKRATQRTTRVSQRSTCAECGARNALKVFKAITRYVPRVCLWSLLAFTIYRLRSMGNWCRSHGSRFRCYSELIPPNTYSNPSIPVEYAKYKVRYLATYQFRPLYCLKIKKDVDSDNRLV